jgi:signal peptidase
MLYDNNSIKRRKNIENKIKNIINNIIYIILIPILIYNVSLIVQAINNPNKTPSFLGTKTYVIISGSMEPNIDIGDIVIVKEIKAENQLKVGDIISYRSNQNVITHRIIRIEEDENGKLQFITKGDNNNTEDDDNITYDNIEGRVEKIIPKFGKIALTLQNKTIILLILIYMYVYFSITIHVKKKKKIRRLKRLEYERKCREL